MYVCLCLGCQCKSLEYAESDAYINGSLCVSPCICVLRRYEAKSGPHTGFRPRNCHPQSGVGNYFEVSELYKARVLMNTMPLGVILDASVWDVPVVSRHTHTHTHDTQSPCVLSLSRHFAFRLPFAASA